MQWALSFILLLGQVSGTTQSLQLERTPPSFPGIIFIKTHKTASSSVAALFRANALLLWNESVFVPRPTQAGLQWDLSDPTHQAMVGFQGNRVTGAGPKWGVWASHARFQPGLYDLVSGHTPLLITVVRNPVDRLESAWRYYTVIGVLRLAPIEALLTNQWEEGKVHSEFHPNGMSLELAGIGLERTGASLKFAIAAAWRSGEALGVAADAIEKFIVSRNLVALVTEKLSVSLECLAKRLRWEPSVLSDYRHVKPTVSSGRSDKGAHMKLNSDERWLIRNASQYDWALYDAALQVLIIDMARYNVRDGKQVATTCRADVPPVHQIITDCQDAASANGEFDRVTHSYLTCRCALLGLDDEGWSSFAHDEIFQYHKNLPSSHAPNMDEAVASAAAAALAPKTNCMFGQLSILCSVASESILDTSHGMPHRYEVVPLLPAAGANTPDLLATGCPNEVDLSNTAVGFQPHRVHVESTGAIGKLRPAGVMVMRGGCSFADKARNMASWGFALIIIVDNVGSISEMPPTPSLGPDSGVQAAVFIISSGSGRLVLAQSSNSTPVVFEAEFV